MSWCPLPLVLSSHHVHRGPVERRIGALVLLLERSDREYERIGHEPIEAAAPPMRTEGGGRKAAEG